MNYCCETMKESIEYNCINQSLENICPDSLIIYIPEFDEYLIAIHDGGKSGILIKYCPWCGKKLPMSRRDLWFDILESLGYDDPYNQIIPIEFKDETWFTSEKYSKLIGQVERINK